MRGEGGGQVSVKTVALVAFVFGVLLHGCVAMTVLGGGGGGDNSSNNGPAVVETAKPAPAPSATPTALPDRTSCDEIRGTEYRSAAERDFFRTHCITSLLPPGPAAPADSTARDPTG